MENILDYRTVQTDISPISAPSAKFWSVDLIPANLFYPLLLFL